MFLRKGTCEECIKNKDKCEHCDEKINGNNLSKHLKERHDFHLEADSTDIVNTEKNFYRIYTEKKTSDKQK